MKQDGSNLPKRTIWVKPYCPTIQIYQKHFKESQKDFYGTLSGVTESVCKCNASQTIFDKERLN